MCEPFSPEMLQAEALKGLKYAQEFVSVTFHSCSALTNRQKHYNKLAMYKSYK